MYMYMYVSEHYLTLLSKVTLFSKLEVMWDGPPHAVSAEYVVFLKLLHVFCIVGKCVFNRIWLSLSLSLSLMFSP